MSTQSDRALTLLLLADSGRTMQAEPEHALLALQLALEAQEELSHSSIKI